MQNLEAVKVLFYKCELHTAVMMERYFKRGGVEVRYVKEDEGLGSAFGEFGPTYVIAGTTAAYEEALALIEKRGSQAKVTMLY